MPAEHFLNADFDLSLRPRWRPPTGAVATHRITDLAWHAVTLAEHDDSVVVPEPAPEDFCEYFHRLGFHPPDFSVEPDHRAERALTPFGWNADAAARSRRYRSAASHPALETVRKVNGRRFSATLERELFGGGHVVAILDSETELRRTLDALPQARDGWVLKAEHGNAGLGNRRLRSPRLTKGDLTVVRRIFAEDDFALLEPWRRRIRDLCATFEVAADGHPGRVRLHENTATADGALIGALFEEDPAPLAEWRTPMNEAASAVAAGLAEEGYFGPACIDAFVWDDGGRHRLRPLVDLNARREMSAGAAALWRRVGGRGAAYWRFLNRRKFDFPAGYRELELALGDDAFDPRSGTGVLVTAPLWLGPDRRRPAKAAMFFAGRDRSAVFALDRQVRERFER